MRFYIKIASGFSSGGFALFCLYRNGVAVIRDDIFSVYNDDRLDLVVVGRAGRSVAIMHNASAMLSILFLIFFLLFVLEIKECYKYMFPKAVFGDNSFQNCCELTLGSVWYILTVCYSEGSCRPENGRKILFIQI